MKYRLEVFPPRKTDGTPSKVFQSKSPFLSIARGDFVDAGSWGSGGGLWRVLNVEHVFGQEEDDVVHTLKLYTRREYYCEATRLQHRW